jgi:hypothetical protein
MRRFLMDRLARPAVLPMALIVALTLISAQRTYAVTTTANASIQGYNFGANGELAVFLPVRNQPIHVMANCITVGFRGIAFVDIMAVTETSAFLMWTGQNSRTSAGAAGNVSGFSDADEAFIADVDFSGGVELEVANASTMVISNETGGARRGLITMMW